MKEFITEKLRSMDLFLTTDWLPQSAAIKKAQGAGAFSDAATHCFFMVEDSTGLLVNCGMGKPPQPYFKFQTGLEMRSLKESINNAPYSSKIVKVLRHPCWDNDANRKAASEFLIYAAKSEQWNLFTDRKVWIKYDWAAFFGYLDPTHRLLSQNRAKAICSEVPDAVAHRFANASYTTIPAWSKRPPTPKDLQDTSWPEITDYLRDVTTPTKEIISEAD